MTKKSHRCYYCGGPARHRPLPPAVFDCECWLCQRIAEAARWAAAQH